MLNVAPRLRRRHQDEYSRQANKLNRGGTRREAVVRFRGQIIRRREVAPKGLVCLEEDLVELLPTSACSVPTGAQSVLQYHRTGLPDGAG